MGDVTLREAAETDIEFAYVVKRAAPSEYVEKVWG